MRVRHVLDEIDYLLLALMQADATRPLHELGDEVGLSPSAVQRRLTRLRAAGVIRAEVAILDPHALGTDLLAVALVALVDDAPEHHTAFRERMLTHPAVQQCYSIVGQWDYVVVLVTADLARTGSCPGTCSSTTGWWPDTKPCPPSPRSSPD